MEWLELDRWSPYAVGIGLGILSWLSFLLSDQALACSTAFTRSAGMLERAVRGPRVLDKPYYRKFVPKVEWGWMLVVGMVIGAFISARLSDTFVWRWVPEVWEQAFGAAVAPRLLMAFGGGVLMGLGARWAGGCTSGHGISGTMQLALSSWIAAACFFAGGIAGAMLIYRVLA